MLRSSRQTQSATPGGSARLDAAVMLLVALAGCAFFWKAASLQGVFFHYDHAIQNYPFRHFFAEGLRRGRMLLWNRDMFCGFPLFAESQGNAAYPPFLALFAAFKPWVAYNYYMVLHFCLAGLFTYMLARVMRVGRAGAALAGIIYMLAGPILYHAHHTNIIVGECWLPALLLLIELACRRRNLLPVLGFAAATGALVLGAQPQYTLYCALVCGIFLLWRLRLIQLVTGKRGPAGRLLIGFGCAAVLGGMLAAVQLLPLMELVGHTSRAAEQIAMPGVAIAAPANIMTLLLPHYFGSPGLGSYWASGDAGMYSEMTLFMGVAPLFLALFGALTDKRRSTLFFVGLGLFAFVFSLGLSGSVYPLFAFLPVFQSSRFPSRFAFVTTLCVAMLAGTGLQSLLKTSGGRRATRAALSSAAVILVLSAFFLALSGAWTGEFASLNRKELAAAVPLQDFHLGVLWRHLRHTLPADTLRLAAVAIAGASLLLLCTRRRLPAPLTVGLWCALVFAELAYTGREFAAVTDPAIYTEPPEMVERLRSLPPGRIFRFRYYDLTNPGNRVAEFPHTRGWALAPELYAASLDKVPHSANIIWNVPAVNGFSPLQTRALKALLGRPRDRSTLIEFDPSPALNLVGARYLLSPRNEIPGDYPILAKVAGVNIFHNADALPRAFIVHSATLAANPETAVQSLRAPEFDHRARIFLHDPSAPLISDSPGAADVDEEAAVVADEHDDITIKARLSRPGYLVLADQHYPGWQVEVDGHPARLLRVDYALKGVALGPGDHTVRFTFRPASFRAGLAISCGTLGILLVAAFFHLIRRRHPAPEAVALPAEPYGPQVARLLLVSTLLFAVLIPVLPPWLWRRMPYQLDPRTFLVHQTLMNTAYLSRDRKLAEAYAVARDACHAWPENPALHARLIRVGEKRAVKLLAGDRRREAELMAAEISSLVPHTIMEKAPALAALARQARRQGRP